MCWLLSLLADSLYFLSDGFVDEGAETHVAGYIVVDPVEQILI